MEIYFPTITTLDYTTFPRVCCIWFYLMLFNLDLSLFSPSIHSSIPRAFFLTFSHTSLPTYLPTHLPTYPPAYLLPTPPPSHPPFSRPPLHRRLLNSQFPGIQQDKANFQTRDKPSDDITYVKFSCVSQLQLQLQDHCFTNPTAKLQYFPLLGYIT